MLFLSANSRSVYKRKHIIIILLYKIYILKKNSYKTCNYLIKEEQKEKHDVKVKYVPFKEEQKWGESKEMLYLLLKGKVKVLRFELTKRWKRKSRREWKDVKK